MIQRVKAMGLLVVSAVLFATLVSSQDTTDTWRGLVVAPEHRCSPYDRKRDYPYPQSIEQDIVRGLGRVYGPYTDTCFASARETDIEHIVATSEAHDSGLCARDRTTQARFASEWLPDRNRCWFAARIVEVRRTYDLTIDRREAMALERILAQCDSTDMKPITCTSGTASAEDRDEGSSGSHALALYDDNGNGRITCREAGRHRIAPVYRDHLAYQYMHDRDDDGVVCE